MNRKLRASLSAFIILSIMGLAVLVFIHYRTRELPQEDFVEDEKVEVSIDRIHYSGTKDGRIEWELDARSASRSREGDLTLFEDVKATFYAKDGSSYTLTAREGTLRELSGEIGVSGDVVIESGEEGYVLRTGTLKYLINEKEVSTPDRVTVTSDRLDLEGIGFLGHIDTGEFRLLKNVKAVFRDSRI
ncbi:MAG: LPS export ABC transporter periplasmic protein LptC [Deltaproteobacteria bacterium]|nr:LPS export ABC transporter periplasmic protein LptC [Deltaproteobacteria bacterium]MBZ0218835.1 LPS export ABC transporter periplasmic protein LptC [Deltaproteobacteria bacterium]